MLQSDAFLKVSHLAEGLSLLLEFLADPKLVNNFDKWCAGFRETHPDNSRCCAILGQAPDLQGGVDCWLNGWCSAPTWSPSIELSWNVDKCFRDFSVTVRFTPRSPISQFLKVRGSDDLHHLRALFPGLPIRELRRLQGRTVHQLLAPFAEPCLFLPISLGEEQALGLLALLALYAGRAGALDIRDPAAFTVFRDYVFRIADRWLCRCPADLQQEVLCRVFQRLYSPKTRGLGFKAPASADAFPAYLGSSIRMPIIAALKRRKAKGSEMPQAERPESTDTEHAPRRKTQRKLKDSSPDPASTIEAAANFLEVNPSTISRRMIRLGYKSWSSEVWEKIRKDVQEKKSWRDNIETLMGIGSSDAAARLQVYRWKKAGLTPSEAIEKLRERYQGSDFRPTGK